MELTIEEVADATNGIIYGERDIIITGVSIDTRTLQNGDLFIPLVAERDGHAFVTEALEKNANAYLFSHGEPQHTSVKVEDTLKALQVIAKISRKKITGEVIAITGSVGKTTTKDIAASILSPFINLLGLASAVFIAICDFFIANSNSVPSGITFKPLESDDKTFTVI